MSASLPMYWRPETAAAWIGFWRDVQEAADAPLPDLTPPEDLPEPWTAHWLSAALVLSQTCSFPLRTALRDKVTYVGTFDFDLGATDAPCPPGHYKSVYIQAAGKAQTSSPPPQRMRFALNAFDSQSGWAATYAAQAPRPALDYVLTDAHAGSLAAVAEGRADEAALDGTTWRLLQRYDPNAQRVIVRGHTDASPGLPLITARGRDPEPLRQALARACTTSRWLGHPDLGGLKGFLVLDEGDYLSLPIPNAPTTGIT